MPLSNILIAGGIYFLNQELFPVALPNSNQQLLMFLLWRSLLATVNTSLTFVISYLFQYQNNDTKYSEAIFSSICINLISITYSLLSQHPEIDFSVLTNTLASASEAIMFFSRASNAILNLGKFDFGST
jgi:hypothetical protein